MFFIATCISLRCCGSAFIKKRTLSLNHLGTRTGMASLNIHLKLNLCWLGMKIHSHTTCLPIDRRDEKVGRWKPMLLEWEVTSTQTTSGHCLNKQNTGFTIQATPMKSVSLLSRFLSLSLLDYLLSKEWNIWFLINILTFNIIRKSFGCGDRNGIWGIQRMWSLKVFFGRNIC